MTKTINHQAVYAEIPQFTKIKDYTDEQLEATIKVLSAKLPSAFQYLNFIDAYFEKRLRKQNSEKAAT
jgi:hypothetical protein